MTQPDLAGEQLIQEARAFATLKHEGQLDKAGLPYITHPGRVAARVQTRYGAAHVAVAWLHDVIEDQNVTPEDLRQLGFPLDVIAGVVAMTKCEGDGPDEAVERACADPIALVVKAADVADNSDPSRLALLEPELRDKLVAKYGRYRAVLDRHSAPVFAESSRSEFPAND